MACAPTSEGTDDHGTTGSSGGTDTAETTDPAADTSTASGTTSMSGTADSTGDPSSSGDESTTGPGAEYPTCLEDLDAEHCRREASSLPPDGEPGGSGPYEVEVEVLDNPEPGAPGQVSVYLPVGLDDVPVIFFSHAYGATVTASYAVLLDDLASQGLAVVFSPYSTAGLSANEQRYTELWAEFLAAAAEHQDRLDLTRVGFVGHSFGAGATPEMARRGFVEEGWGSSGRLMFMMAPWYSWGHDYDTIPDDTKIVMQVYADDAINDHQIAVQDIWDALPPTAERRWQLIGSDVCDCGLTADHFVPLAMNVAVDPRFRFNGLDAWGVQRRIVALARYAFEGDQDAAAIAFGDDTEMGGWLGCDGRPVRPLESSTEPLTTTCVGEDALMFPLSARCDYADIGVACP